MRIRKIVLTAVLVGIASYSSAQSFYEQIIKGVPVAKTLTAVSTDNAMVIKYVGGASGGGEVAVDAATGDITLTVATVADTTTECPVAAPYAGVIDVSDASCNTLGEVCDAINFSANWRCVILDGLRTDSTVNTLATIGATTADAKDGLALKWDTAVALTMTQTLVPSNASIDFYFGSGGTSPSLIANPFKDTQMGLLYFSENSAHTANTINIYSVKVNNKLGALNAAGTGFVGGSETVNSTFTATGGATGVTSAWDFRSVPYLGLKGDKLVMRVTTTVSLTAPTLMSWGYYFKPAP